MNSLFILLLPSVLGLKIINHLYNKKSNRDLVFYYLLLVLCSNILCMLFVVSANKFDGNLCLYMNEHLIFSFKYLILSVFTNIILGFAFSILIKNFKFSLEVKNEKKNN